MVKWIKIQWILLKPLPKYLMALAIFSIICMVYVLIPRDSASKAEAKIIPHQPLNTHKQCLRGLDPQQLDGWMKANPNAEVVSIAYAWGRGEGKIIVLYKIATEQKE